MGEEGNLGEFMESITLMAEVDNLDSEENAVVLMTLHSAKGLEFPVVFIAGMEDGLFPSWRSLEKPGGVAGERRLCYVGMTRAERRLFLTGADMRTVYGKTGYTQESMFLKEIDSRFMDGDAVFAGRKYSVYSGFSHTSHEEEKEIFRPFDQLRHMKQDEREKTGLSPGELIIGDEVEHSKFGKGQVVAIHKNAATVIFESVGTKKLAIDVAPLKKL